MIRPFALALGAILFLGVSIEAEIRSWRIGDDEHPWTLRPVSGRIDLGRGWGVELLADDDGDGVTMVREGAGRSGLLCGRPKQRGNGNQNPECHAVPALTSRPPNV